MCVWRGLLMEAVWCPARTVVTVQRGRVAEVCARPQAQAPEAGAICAHGKVTCSVL